MKVNNISVKKGDTLVLQSDEENMFEFVLGNVKSNGYCTFKGFNDNVNKEMIDFGFKKICFLPKNLDSSHIQMSISG